MTTRPKQRETPIRFPEIGICGLSCRLCPSFVTQAQSRCGGCKSELRMRVGCPFITCAVKRKGLEFCWECEESRTCTKWLAHRKYGQEYDTFKCYQTLEDDIAYIEKHGVLVFEREQKAKEKILREMLVNFNEGRSKSYLCIAASVFSIQDLKGALSDAHQRSKGRDLKEKAAVLHSILDRMAEERGYDLKLRKYKP